MIFRYTAGRSESFDPLLSLRQIATQQARKTLFIKPPWCNAHIDKAWLAKHQTSKQENTDWEKAIVEERTWNAWFDQQHSDLGCEEVR